MSPYSRSMCVRTVETKSRTVQMRRSKGLKLNPSWSEETMVWSLTENRKLGTENWFSIVSIVLLNTESPKAPRSEDSTLPEENRTLCSFHDKYCPLADDQAEGSSGLTPSRPSHQ